MFENPTVNLHELCSYCAKIGCRSSFFIEPATFKIQARNSPRASCIHLPFVNFALHPTPHTHTHTHNPTQSNSSISVPTPTPTISTMLIRTFFANERYYRLPKYRPFLLNHPVVSKLLTVTPNTRTFLCLAPGSFQIVLVITNLAC